MAKGATAADARRRKRSKAGRRGEAKASRSASRGAVAGDGEVPPGPADPAAGYAVRRYDLPYSAPDPRLLNADVGLQHLVALAGPDAGYTIDVTLLDAPDHRLVRAGVLLAHRVIDGRGEWYLSAPDWAPLLPVDRVELMGHADLPQEFADLIRPLRRRATLGPVAALSCERGAYALRDGQGRTVALVGDDKVTVRRNGLTTARYREVRVDPTGPGLTEGQVAWLDRVLAAGGATAVASFPPLVARLGAPATGPTDVPPVEPLDLALPLRTVVARLLGARLRGIVAADLALRDGRPEAAGELRAEAERLRRELTALSAVVDAEWLEDLYDELDWVVAGPVRQVGSGPDPLPGRLRSERYLMLLERLVAAVRAPQLSGPDGFGSGQQLRSGPAGEVLAGLLAQAAAGLAAAADPLTPDAPDAAWQQVRRESRRLAAVHELAAVLGSPAPAALGGKAERLLLAAAETHRNPDAATRVAGLTALEAFDAGRAYERGLAETWRVRQEFVERWPKVRRRLLG